jgi:hypothetical protein
MLPSCHYRAGANETPRSTSPNPAARTVRKLAAAILLLMTLQEGQRLGVESLDVQARV